MKDDAREMIEDFVELFYRQVNPREAFRRHVADDYIQHNPGFRDGPQAALDGLAKIFRRDTRLEVKRVIVEGEYAVVHVHGVLEPGTLGVAVVDIYRIANGKIVEHWDVIQPVPENSVSLHPMF